MAYTKAQAQAYSAEFAIRSVLDNVAASEEPIVITVAGSSLVIPLERKFGRIEDIQAYVDLCCHMIKATPPRVRSRKSIKHAHYQSGEIAIPTNETQAAGKSGWAMREIVVLHELAHHLTPNCRDDGGHGSAFVATFLDLIKRFMGHETWLLAFSTFHSAGVALGASTIPA